MKSSTHTVIPGNTVLIMLSTSLGRFSYLPMKSSTNTVTPGNNVLMKSTHSYTWQHCADEINTQLHQATLCWWNQHTVTPGNTVLMKSSTHTVTPGNTVLMKSSTHTVTPGNTVLMKRSTYTVTPGNNVLMKSTHSYTRQHCADEIIYTQLHQATLCWWNDQHTQLHLATLCWWNQHTVTPGNTVLMKS